MEQRNEWNQYRDQTKKGPEVELEKAVSLLARITELAENASSFAEARQLFELTNVHLFVKFERVPTPKPRKDGQDFINQLSGGILTIGDAPAPVPVYDGPTSRRDVKPQRDEHAEPTIGSGPIEFSTDGKDDVLGKQSRGDWRSFEPLIVAIADTVLAPTAETIVATRVLRLSA